MFCCQAHCCFVFVLIFDFLNFFMTVVMCKLHILYGTCFRYRLVPYGNHSYLESLTDKSKELPLYSAGGIKFFWDTKYVLISPLSLLIYRSANDTF